PALGAQRRSELASRMLAVDRTLPRERSPAGRPAYPGPRPGLRPRSPSPLRVSGARRPLDTCPDRRPAQSRAQDRRKGLSPRVAVCRAKPSRALWLFNLAGGLCWRTHQCLDDLEEGAPVARTLLFGRRLAA